MSFLIFSGERSGSSRSWNNIFSIACTWEVRKYCGRTVVRESIKSWKIVNLIMRKLAANYFLKLCSTCVIWSSTLLQVGEQILWFFIHIHNFRFDEFLLHVNDTVVLGCVTRRDAIFRPLISEIHFSTNGCFSIFILRLWLSLWLPLVNSMPKWGWWSKMVFRPCEVGESLIIDFFFFLKLKIWNGMFKEKSVQ